MPHPASDPRYIKRHRKARNFFERIHLWALQRLAWPHLLAQKHAHLKNRSFKSVLIIRHNMLGDAVVSSVLVQALKALYPDTSISVLASPYNREAFSWLPGVDHIHVWPDSLSEQRALIARLKGRFDLVFQTLFDENYINRMTVARTIAGDGVLIGRARRSPIQGLMDHAVELPMGSYAGKLLSLLAPLTDTPLGDLVNAHPRYLLSLPESDKASAWNALTQAGVTGPFVLLNISAREPFRSMGDEQATDTARALVAAGHPVVISCSPGELQRARALKAQVPGAFVCEHATLGAAMAAVEHAALYVGPDTGTVHFAAAAGVPAVVLFAAIARPDIWSPYGTPFISLQAGVHQTVADIPVDTIVECARELLQPSARSVQRIQIGTPLFFSQPFNRAAHQDKVHAAKPVKKVAAKS